MAFTFGLCDYYIRKTIEVVIFGSLMENQNIEYKSSWRDEYLQELCAFANTNGGKLFIGIDDNGNVIGVSKIKILLETIPSKVTNHLGVSAKVNHIVRETKDVIEIDIEKSSSLISYKGKIYTRSGSTTQLVQNHQLSDLILNRTGDSWTDTFQEGATINDIDENAVREFQEKAAKKTPSIAREESIQNVLQKLKLIDDGKITRAALLLFGKDPQRYSLSAFVQIGLFETDTKVIQTDRIEGNLFHQADETLALFQTKYLTHRHEFKNTIRYDILEYPEEAIREVLYNAIIHKDYLGHHIQIKIYPHKIRAWNPGALHPSLTYALLKGDHLSLPRNKLIANAFYLAGYIENWGRGTNTIVEKCIEASLPEPEFIEQSGGFIALLSKDKYSEKNLTEQGLNDRQIKAVEYMKQNDFITNSLYQELYEVGRSTSLRDLNELLEKGVIERLEVKGRNTKYKINY